MKSKKRTALAIAAVGVAMLVLPAVASAGTWHLEKVGGGTPGTFTGTGGASELVTTSNLTLKSVTTTIHGEFETTTTGTITVTFHGMTGLFGIHCQTAGQPTGTVVTTKLTFHLVNLEPSPNPKKPGILITPNHTTGNFAHFECGGIAQTLAGNGVLGELVSPACGAKTTALEFKFQRSAILGAGHQKWTQITTTGTFYDLTLGGSTASLDDSFKLITPESLVNCT